MERAKQVARSTKHEARSKDDLQDEVTLGFLWSVPPGNWAVTKPTKKDLQTGHIQLIFSSDLAGSTLHFPVGTWALTRNASSKISHRDGSGGFSPLETRPPSGYKNPAAPPFEVAASHSLTNSLHRVPRLSHTQRHFFVICAAHSASRDPAWRWHPLVFSRR